MKDADSLWPHRESWGCPRKATPCCQCVHDLVALCLSVVLCINGILWRNLQNLSNWGLGHSLPVELTNMEAAPVMTFNKKKNANKLLPCLALFGRFEATRETEAGGH